VRQTAVYVGDDVIDLPVMRVLRACDCGEKCASGSETGRALCDTGMAGARAVLRDAVEYVLKAQGPLEIGV